MALEMRTECGACGEKLKPDDKAFICSYECTFCVTCSQALHHTCPDCDGELVRRPRRRPE